MSNPGDFDWNNIEIDDSQTFDINPEDLTLEDGKARNDEKKEKVRSQTRERQKKFRERRKAAVNELEGKILELKQMLEKEQRDHQELQMRNRGLLWAADFCDETVKVLQFAGESLADDSPQRTAETLEYMNTDTLKAEMNEEVAALAIKTSETCPEGCLREQFSPEALESFLKILKSPKIQDLQEVKEIQTLVDATAIVLGNGPLCTIHVHIVQTLK